MLQACDYQCNELGRKINKGRHAWSSCDILIRDGLSHPAWQKKNEPGVKIDRKPEVCHSCPQFFELFLACADERASGIAKSGVLVLLACKYGKFRPVKRFIYMRTGHICQAMLEKSESHLAPPDAGPV